MSLKLTSESFDFFRFLVVPFVVVETSYFMANRLTKNLKINNYI